jgi:energy-coupling factor transport system ATP-binding protein
MDIIRRRVGFVLYKHLNIFVGETVKDEIVFGLESLAMSKDDITQILASECRLFKLDELLERDPNSLGSSDKVKMKILSALIVKPNVLVIDNIMCELDYEDKLLVFDILKEYSKNGMIIINFTNDIEEALFGDKVIVIYDKKVICEGKTMSVLNEEKILKRLNVGLPFIVELSKYFMDYGMIDKYYLTNEKLIGALWK